MIPPLTPDRLHRVMATLAPMAALASAGGLRALPAAPRDGQSGGGDPQAWVDALHQRGDAARARAAWQRLQRVPVAHRAALEWLADRGQTRPPVDTAASLYAQERGPIALREAVDAAVRLRQLADCEVLAASPRRRGHRGITAEQVAARALLAQRQAEERRAEERLTAWGRDALGAAVAAWDGEADGVAA